MNKSLNPIEIILFTLFSLAGLCGLMLGLFSLVAPSGGVSVALIGFGLVAATLGSMAMMGLRNRTNSASAWLAAAITMWFIGVNLLGLGGFTALTPSEQGAAANLAYTFIFCWLPGGFLTLLGLTLYGYDYRRRSAVIEAAQAEATISSVQLKQNDKMTRMEQYRQQTIKIIKQRASILGEQADSMITRLEQWVARLRRLQERLDTFNQDTLIQRDLSTVPQQITQLQTQLQAEPHPQLRAQIQETLESYHQQKAQLDSLVTLMRRTELEVDEALARMGAMYSQLQLLEARDIDHRRATRLVDDIEEQVNHLEDLLTAMDETYHTP